MSKFCGLGQVGFPQGILKRRRLRGFPLNTQLLGCPEHSLIAT